MGDHIDEEEVYLNPSKYVSDESFDHVHRELCLAALTPLKSWLKVYPVLILKLIILSVFFAFLPPFLIGVLQAVVSLTFLFLVFYRDVVMRGVVDFIDLIHSARGDESRYAEESNGGAQSLHPQYFYILQQACFKVSGEAFLFLYFSICEQILLSSAPHNLKVLSLTVPFSILLTLSVIIRPFRPLNAVRYACALAAVRTSSNYMCSLSLGYLTLVLEFALAIFMGVTKQISMTKNQWIACVAFLLVMILVPLNFYVYLTSSDLAPLTSTPLYCICTLGLTSESPEFPFRRLPLFIIFGTMIAVKFIFVLWFSAKTSFEQQLKQVSTLRYPGPHSNPNAVNWTGGSMLRTNYNNLMNVIPAQVEWDEGWQVRQVEGYWNVFGVGEVYWNSAADDM